MQGLNQIAHWQEEPVQLLFGANLISVLMKPFYKGQLIDAWSEFLMV